MQHFIAYTEIQSAKYIVTIENRYINDLKKPMQNFFHELANKSSITIIKWLKKSAFLIGQNRTSPFLIKHTDHREILHER